MRHKPWPWLGGAVLLTTACFLFLSSRSLPNASGRETNYQGFRILGTVIELIKHDYVEEPNAAKTMDGAFRGLVDSLDILSTYLGPGEAQKYMDSQKPGFKDPGIALIKAYGGFPQVVGLVENSPASKSELKPGDGISTINGRSTLSLSLVETQLALKSRGDEPVQLKVLRQNRTLDLTLNRAPSDTQPVSLAPAPGTAGVLRLGRMDAPSVAAAKAALAAGLRPGSGPLVLDLRNCWEGEPDAAAGLLNLFLRADRVGTFLKKQGGPEVVSCPQEAPWDKIPLAVWTNLGTQGAAEIVAAVLQDFRRAKVIGLETPGLAAKTRLLPLQDGSALLLTAEVFALNSGTKIWGAGVKPDGKIDPAASETKAYLAKTVELQAGR